MHHPIWIHHTPSQLSIEYADCSLVLHAPQHSGVQATHIETELITGPRAHDPLSGAEVYEGVACLGVASVDGEHYVVIATKGTPINGSDATLGIESVVSLDKMLFFCLGQPTLDPDASRKSHPCVGLNKLLTSGQFYFALDPLYDLTKRLQPYSAHDPAPRDPRLASTFDEDFVSNHAWLAPLQAYRERLSSTDKDTFDRCNIGAVLMHGFIGVRHLELAGEPVMLAVISRRAYQREGTRFAERGIDAKGDVAGYAETETCLFSIQRSASFVQLRGSVPCFWTERGTMADQPLIDVTNVSLDEEQSAMRRHFAALVDHYGARIECLNLLSPSTYTMEATLTSLWEEHLREMKDGAPVLAAQVGYTALDLYDKQYHASVPVEEYAVKNAVSDLVQSAGMTVVAFAISDKTGDPHPIETLEEQTSVWRTTCRDCLDRTNLAQDQISLVALTRFTLACWTPQMEDCQALERAHRELFADNGDALSRIMTGAGAMWSAYVRSGDMTKLDEKADDKVEAERRMAWQVLDPWKEKTIRVFEREDKLFELEG